MEKAKLFINGRSQAVRIPAALRFSADVQQVQVERDGERLILRPDRPNWDSFFDAAPEVPDDFMLDRDDAPPQSRDPL